MELLVVTLARTAPSREADGLAQIRLVNDTVRYAPGLVTLRAYRSREAETYYLTLTTWEDEEAWQKAQERYNPKQLLVAGASDLLLIPPKQWLMHYLWGYSRPATQTVLAAAHVASIRPDQTEYARRGWVESLRREVVQPTLASAFLARGLDEETLSNTTASEKAPSDAINRVPTASYLQGPIFLNLLNWPDQANEEEFYTDPDYQAINRFLTSVGIVQVLAIEPL